METTLTFNDFIALGALMLPLCGAIFMAFRALRADMNQRFADAQRANDQAHAHIGENIKSLERANDQAHAHVGENIKSLERQIEGGLNRVHMQLAAVTPRAAADTGPPDAA